MIHISQFRLCFDQGLDNFHSSLDGSRKLIHILWLDDGLEIIFEDLGEVVCSELVMGIECVLVQRLRTLQFGATEISQDFFPIGRIVISTQVRFQFTTENLQGCTLADTVCSHQTQDLTRSWHGQSVQLEAVCRVTMGDLGLEIGRQIDDVDGTKWAFFGANTTTDA